MPSTFRSSRSGRQLDSSRTRTGQIDHDVFEGLPVRRWSRQPHTHSQVPKSEDSEFVVQGPGGIGRLPELAMPRDSQLLGAGSRALLRAARAGCIYIHQNARISDKDDKEAGEGDDGAPGTHSADRTFTSRKWTTLPKQLEPADVEFLAKRRPGLPSLYGGAAAMDGSVSGPGSMRRTKFKKTDPTTGKISIYEAWVPEGHRIEGEITGDIQTIAGQNDVPVNSETPAPGTVVEGVGVVNSEGVVIAEAGSASVMTPPKRRPPPPKRKGKGIGKGRKKKVMFAPGEGADATAVHGVPRDTSAHTDGLKDGPEASQMPIDQSGQEDDEDDGEDGEDSDEADESMMDAKTPETPQAPYPTESADHPSVDIPTDTKDVEMTDVTLEPQLPVSHDSSVTGQEAPPEPFRAPEASPMESHQTETDPQASVTPVPTTETIKKADTSTEQTTDLNKQLPVKLAPQEPHSESIHPEAPPESTTGTELEDQSSAHEPAPAVGTDNALDDLAAKPIQAATEIEKSELKPENEHTGEDTLAPASADLEIHAEGNISDPANKPEPAPELAAEELANPTPAESNSVPALSPEDGKNGEDLPAALEGAIQITKPKEDLHLVEAPTTLGHDGRSSQPEESPTAEHPAMQSSIPSLAATEPLLSATDAAEPSGPSETKPNPEIKSPSSHPEPIQPDPAMPEASDFVNTQAPAFTEPESTSQEQMDDSELPSRPTSDST